MTLLYCMLNKYPKVSKNGYDCKAWSNHSPRWSETHKLQMPTWTIASTYFFERFGGKNITIEAQIPKFVQGMDLHIHKAATKNGADLDTKMRIFGHIFLLPH